MWQVSVVLIVVLCCWVKACESLDFSKVRSFLVPSANAATSETSSSSKSDATSPHQSEKELKEGIANFYDKVSSSCI